MLYNVACLFFSSGFLCQRLTLPSANLKGASKEQQFCDPAVLSVTEWGGLANYESKITHSTEAYHIFNSQGRWIVTGRLDITGIIFFSIAHL